MLANEAMRGDNTCSIPPVVRARESGYARQVFRGDLVEIFVTIRPGDNGESTIVLDMPDAVYAQLTEMAAKRGLSIEDTIGEALRLEKMFADATVSDNSSLLFKSGRRTRVLEAV